MFSIFSKEHIFFKNDQEPKVATDLAVKPVVSSWRETLKIFCVRLSRIGGGALIVFFFAFRQFPLGI